MHALHIERHLLQGAKAHHPKAAVAALAAHESGTTGRRAVRPAVRLAESLHPVDVVCIRPKADTDCLFLSGLHLLYGG